MNVSLEAIKFNHNSSSAATDGLNIRRNETRSVTIPEWQRGSSVNPEDSPAAYSLYDTFGNTLTIQAKFKCSDPDTQAIEVRAVDGALYSSPSWALGFIRFFTWVLRSVFRRSAGSVLGEVKRRYVYLSAGETEFETFELENVRIWEAGIGLHDIVWCWQYRHHSSQSWTDFATSRHRIYTVLREPTKPWLQKPFDNTNTQIPWTEVLDYACRWAAGVKNIDEAAIGITRNVYDLGPKTVFYPKDDTSPHYVGWFFQYFNCTLFLDRLRGGVGNGYHVNCTDCAAFVSTFANILGCDLWVSQMNAFKSNPIKLIGQKDWTVHDFDYHEVAWKGECDENEPVFDACLLVDGDDYPDREPQKPQLPGNLRFGASSDRQYRFRLVSPRAGREAALPQPKTTRTRRKVSSADFFKVAQCSAHPGVSDTSDSFYDFVAYLVPNRLDEKFLLWLFASGEGALLGWRLHHANLFMREDSPSVIETLWTPPDDTTEIALRLDAYICNTKTVAHNLLLEFVKLFQMPVLTGDESVGDIAVVGPEKVTVIFARSEFVLAVRNAGRQMISMFDIAYQLDQLIISRANVSEE